VAWAGGDQADDCAGQVFSEPDFAAAKDFVERVMEKNELGPAEVESPGGSWKRRAIVHHSHGWKAVRPTCAERDHKRVP